MSGTEVDVVTGEILPHPYAVSRQRDTFGVVADALRLAEAIAKTEMVPQVLRGRADAVVAVMLAGYELGLGPMQSLQTIDLIQGRPALSPEGMRALVLSHGHGQNVEAADHHSKVSCHRREWPPENDWRTFTFTIADAERADLLGKDNWKKYPRAMLMARATGEACRAVFADVIAGLGYTPDELDTLPDVTPPPRQPAPSWRDARGALAEPEGQCAVEGAAELVADLMSERPGIQSAFKAWRLSQKYAMPPETPEQLAAMQTELAKIRAEEARDSYEPPVGSPID